MTLLDTFEVRSPLDVQYIELHQGDILAKDSLDLIDFLVISAFPGDYLPTPTSLIGQLALLGLSVQDLSTRKAADLTTECACWMSEELPHGVIPYRRILCFEPQTRGAPPEVVGDIFRAILPFMGETSRSYTAAMPLVATGDQRTPVEHMLGPLLDAAAHWMARGVALERLMIFVRDERSAAIALDVFARAKRVLNPRTEMMPPEFDLFISYAHEQSREMELLTNEVQSRVPGTKMFVDKIELRPGTAWEPALIDAIDASRAVVPLYSSDYLRSRVCNDEFNAAFARWRSRQLQLLPLKIYESHLLPHMKKLHYEDCREGDPQKIVRSVDRIIESLGSFRTNPGVAFMED